MSETPLLPQETDGGKFRIDLTTVTHVMINSTWLTVRRGSFAVGYPVFCIPTGRVTSGAVWSYGEGYHPLSYFFTTKGGGQRTGPYHHIQQVSHRTVPETGKES